MSSNKMPCGNLNTINSVPAAGITFWRWASIPDLCSSFSSFKVRTNPAPMYASFSVALFSDVGQLCRISCCYPHSGPSVLRSSSKIYLNQLHLIIKEGGKGKKAKKKKRKARAQKCRVSYMYAASNLKFIGRMRLTFQILFHISGVALVK